MRIQGTHNLTKKRVVEGDWEREREREGEKEKEREGDRKSVV